MKFPFSDLKAILFHLPAHAKLCWEEFDGRKVVHILNMLAVMPLYIAVYVPTVVFAAISTIVRTYLMKVEFWAFRQENETIKILSDRNNRLVKEKFELCEKLAKLTRTSEN